MNSKDPYGNEETIAIENYHRSRRMFCIYNEKLIIAEPGLPYSHIIWFEKMGISVDDELMNNMVRGLVDQKGDVYFYVGYDFEINTKAEKIFFEHLKELGDKLDLLPATQVFGGVIKSEPGTPWPPRKAYGQIQDLLA